MTSPLTARFARRTTRGVLLGLSAARVAVLSVGAVAFLFWLLVLHGAAGLLAGAIAAAPLVAAASIPVGGRAAVEWAPVAVHWQARKVTGQTTWRAKPDKPRPAGTLALPGDAAALRFYVPPSSSVAMIHDPWRNTLAAVLHVTHPAYVLLAPGDQETRVASWGRVLASLAQSGTCSSLQVLETTVPDSGQATVDWYDAHGAHSGMWADQQYRQLLDQNAAGSTAHRTTITLTLDLKRAAAAVKASGGGLAGAAKVLQGDMAGLEFGLRAAGLGFGAWASEAEVAQMIRQAYDPQLGGEFTSASPGANLAHAGPLAVNEQWGRLRHDSGFSTVLWISEWPRIDVPAHFLHALLFTAGVRKTFSLVCRPRGTAEALRQIRKEKGDIIADQAHKAKVGQVANLSDSQEYDDVVAREKALISGHADVEFTGWIAVTADSEDGLSAAVKQVERAAMQCGCETRTLFGQQSQAFVTAALPLGRSTL